MGSIHNRFGVRALLLIVLFAYESFVFASPLNEWQGKWDSVAEPVESPQIYYYLEMRLKGEGISWTTVNRDVPYGPNEDVSSGFAEFTSETEALDVENKLSFYRSKSASGQPTILMKRQSGTDAGDLFYAVPKFYKAGFDCKKAATKIEKAICSDKRVAQGDFEINQQYRLARKQLKDAELAALKKSQRRWVKRRNQCEISGVVDYSCLARIYANRLATLQKLNNPALGQGDGVNSSYLMHIDNKSVNSNTVLLLLVAGENKDWAAEMAKYPLTYSVADQKTNFEAQIKYSFDSVCWPSDCIRMIKVVISLNEGSVDIKRSENEKKK